MPSQEFSHTARAQAPPSEVWTALDEPSTWESIGGVDRVYDPVIDEEGRLRGFKFETLVAGQVYRGAATPNARDEGTKMAWDIANSEITGTTTVELAPVADDTNLIVTVQVASRSFLAGMFFPVIAGALGSGLPQAVEGFAQSFAD